LRALWPHAIESDELFSLLTPPKREHFLGAYTLFLSAELAPHLQIKDLPPALEFIANLKPRHEMSSVLESLINGIVKQAWEHLDAPGISQAFAKMVGSRLKHHDELIKGRLESRDHLIFSEDDDKRRRLLKALFPILAEDSELDVVWLIFSSTPLILSHDFHWLISHLNNNQSVEVQTLLVRAIERLFDGTKPIHLETIWDASKYNDVLAKAFKWVWQAIDLNSQEASEMKGSYQERLKWQSKRQPVLLEPAPDQRVADLLKQCESDNSGAWWQLNLEMTLEPTSTHYGDPLETEITNLPGWRSADARTRIRIMAAAKKYLIEQDSNVQSGLARI
jgi:hypothetical protein